MIIISFFESNFTKKNTAPLREQLEKFYTDLQNNRTSTTPTNTQELSRPLTAWNAYITKLDALEASFPKSTDNVPDWAHNSKITPDDIKPIQSGETLTLAKEPSKEQLTELTRYIGTLKENTSNIQQNLRPIMNQLGNISSHPEVVKSLGS